MDKQKKPLGVRRLVKLAYHPGSNPKRPLPGPLYDLTVVGMFVVLGLGYLATGGI